MSKRKKVLFINFGGIGDEILFLPTILSFKKQYPECEITLALEKRSSGITSLTNVLDKTLYADIKGKNKYNELIKLLFKIWGEGFNLVVSSGSNKFISLFLLATLIPKRIGYDTGKLSQKVLTKAITLNKNQYAVNMYHDLVADLTGCKAELPKIDVPKVADWLGEESKFVEPNSVLIHPGVSKMSIEKNIINSTSSKINNYMICDFQPISSIIAMISPEYLGYFLTSSIILSLIFPASFVLSSI